MFFKICPPTDDFQELLALFSPCRILGSARGDLVPSRRKLQFDSFDLKIGRRKTLYLFILYTFDKTNFDKKH